MWICGEVDGQTILTWTSNTVAPPQTGDLAHLAGTATTPRGSMKGTPVATTQKFGHFERQQSITGASASERLTASPRSQRNDKSPVPSYAALRSSSPGAAHLAASRSKSPGAVHTHGAHVAMSYTAAQDRLEKTRDSLRRSASPGKATQSQAPVRHLVQLAASPGASGRKVESASSTPGATKEGEGTPRGGASGSTRVGRTSTTPTGRKYPTEEVDTVRVATVVRRNSREKKRDM